MNDPRYHCTCTGTGGLSGVQLNDGSTHYTWCERVHSPPVLSVFKLQPDAALPRRAMEGSIGYDIEAYIKTGSGRDSTKTLGPQQTFAFPTGLVVLPPAGHSILVCTRSGLGMGGVIVTNAPGVIDPDYTGELKILLTNVGWEPFYVKHGYRIAQLLIIPRPATPDVVTIETLPATERADRGFGSTGA